jgi:6-phosphogluconate dehydrogenase (decarboxylating)
MEVPRGRLTQEEIEMKANIGLIGLAVMGENLAMNMESKGFTVAVYNRTADKVQNFVNGRAAGKNIIGTYSLQELADSLEKPRKVLMMVKAGQVVDDFIEKLMEVLEPGDIIIDGGNSHYPDTIRRTAYVESKGFHFMGCGVSGGEEGALTGPSLMPGGSEEAWNHVKPILQAICAKVEDGSPCCDWVGENGALYAKFEEAKTEFMDDADLDPTFAQFSKRYIGAEDKRIYTRMRPDGAILSIAEDRFICDEQEHKIFYDVFFGMELAFKKQISRC